MPTSSIDKSAAGEKIANASGKTTLRVHYPNATGIAIRGSITPLDWSNNASVTQEDANTFSLTVTASGDFEWKPMLLSNGNWLWSKGANFKAKAGQTQDVWPRFFTDAGYWTLLWSQFVSYQNGLKPHDIWVYYPASYFENTLATFPVLYMHDGQNLFDASLAGFGNEWKVDETLQAAEQDGSIREMIVIGIGNTPDRVWEYTPTTDPDYPEGGGADVYLRFITDELMPQVNQNLRTQTGAGVTGMLGSSLGGLVSSYAGTTLAGTFGRIGVMSPSTWWNNEWIDGQVSLGNQPGPSIVYLDNGDVNDDQDLTPTLAADYNNVGYTTANGNFKYVVQHGGQHSEIYWAQRLPGALQFLFGPVP